MTGIAWVLGHDLVCELAYKVAGKINELKLGAVDTPVRMFPIPRGGIPAAYLVEKYMDGNAVIVEKPENADVFIDDIIDSGATMMRYLMAFPRVPFYGLVDKLSLDPFYREFKDSWVVFPWESTQESSIESNIVRLLQFVGEDVKREGLKETPARVAKVWKEWCSGYGQEASTVLKSFEDGAEGVDEMVAQKDLPFYSHCEHHMAPFFGTVTVAYVPDKKIVGLSKLSRLVDVFAKRLQVQERLTNQIAGALMDELQPKGVGVLIKARHLCMESRGIAKQGQTTITSALRGVLLSKPEARAEFLDLAR